MDIFFVIAVILFVLSVAFFVLGLTWRAQARVAKEAAPNEQITENAVMNEQITVEKPHGRT